MFSGLISGWLGKNPILSPCYPFHLAASCILDCHCHNYLQSYTILPLKKIPPSFEEIHTPRTGASIHIAIKQHTIKFTVRSDPAQEEFLKSKYHETST
jgi:hypothetical protein